MTTTMQENGTRITDLHKEMPCFTFMIQKVFYFHDWYVYTTEKRTQTVNKKSHWDWGYENARSLPFILLVKQKG